LKPGGEPGFVVYDALLKILFYYYRFARIFVLYTRAMITKLTLTVQDTVIKKAKVYARHTGRSLSELVEKYLDELTDPSVSDEHLSPKLKSLIGAVKLPDDFDEDKVLREYFEKKHL
jgi:hypothetical protein